jgi:hypothetical protein
MSQLSRDGDSSRAVERRARCTVASRMCYADNTAPDIRPNFTPLNEK